MPDSTTPASQMIRVPTPLIDAVKELSRLHRQGHTRAVLSRLQHLIADIDSNHDSDGASVRDSDITTDSRIDSETIVGMIAAAMAPIQEKIAQIEKTTTSRGIRSNGTETYAKPNFAGKRVSQSPGKQLKP